jgi:hypothetical protein
MCAALTLQGTKEGQPWAPASCHVEEKEKRERQCIPIFLLFSVYLLGLKARLKKSRTVISDTLSSRC